MKITTKTTKEEMTKFLGENAKAVQSKDKSLFDRLAYAGKMYKKDPEKVTRKDLVDLVKDVVACLTPAPTPVVAEASLKKPLKKGQKKSEEVASEPVEEPVEEPVKAVPSEEKKTAKVDPKKSANKTKAEKKVEPKKSGDADLNKKSTVSFEEEFELEGEKYTLAPDIKSMDDLYKALEAEERVVFAFSWMKAQIKQFNYFNGQVPTPKEFPKDLDLATCIYASDAGVVAYAVSQYTEANYCILPSDFEVVDNVRYCAGIEYQIYRITE